MSTYREKSRKSDFESFANKIFTGIKELIPEYAEKRAIWELFQNALDVIEKNGIIIIEKTVIGFKFSHNGKPFNHDNVGALIKQYSSGKTYGDNGEEVGQYGTGFISTHVYGKNIKINGNIKLDDGTYRDLENFNLIRNSTSPELLTLELLRQDDYISDLCDNIEKKIEFPQNNITSFEYIASEINKSSINKMFEYSKIINLTGHASVGNMHQDSRISTIKFDANIDEMHNDSSADIIKHMGKVNEMHGFSVIEEMHDNTIVNKMFDKIGKVT